MTFIFSKLLLFLLNPAFWLVVFLLYFYFAKNKKWKRISLTLVLITFVVFSNAWFFNLCVKNYEAGYPSLKKYKYGLLLGGFSGLNAAHQINFNRSGDRLFQTILLYKTGRIEKIILASGNADIFIDRPKEADLVANYLKEIGLPDSALIIENQSRNTKENLLNSRHFLKHNEPVLVITSAWHIPRVKLIAQSLGQHNFDFYPSNSLIGDQLSGLAYVMPSLAVLDNWSLILKEWVGCMVVKMGIQ